jgi:chemotaxis protein MotB
MRGASPRETPRGTSTMNALRWSHTWLLGLLLLPMTTGCVTSRAHQAAMDEKDKTISELREERSQLKSQIQGLKTSLDSAHGDLTAASAKMNDADTTMPVAKEKESVEKIPELDNVGVTYGMRDGNMVLSIPSSITFASGQSTLSKDGEKALAQVAATLKKKYPNGKYSIEGHTDSDPIKKSKFTSNRELSVMRAMAVLTYLVEDCHVSDKQCVVAGHGEYTPVAANDNDKDKAKNRRVEIVVHGK